MKQLDLFGDAAAHAADMEAKRKAAERGETAQQRQLDRVYKGMKGHLLAVRKLYSTGDEFTLTDIERSLRSMGVEFRPDSPRRVMSELRREGLLSCEVVNRSQGLWRWL